MTLSRINHAGAAAACTLASSITASDVALTLSGVVSGYPTSNFVIKLDAGTASEEKILVGTRSSTSCSSLTRAYDGTAATSHSSGAAIEHDLAAVVIDDANDHVYTTTRDDHPQYAKTDGTRAFSGAVTVSTGGLTVTAGGLTVSAGTAAVQALTATTLVASSTAQATAHTATLTGTNGRYVGTTNGAPAAGTYLTNDFANDPTNGAFWICTAGGTPGTWAQAGGATDAAWTAPTLINSWAILGAPFTNPGYRKVAGRVYLRGSVKNGAGGSVAFVLPTGYRPSAELTFSVDGDAGGGTFTAGRCTVDTSGNVTPSSGNPSSFDGVSFDLL